MLTQLFVKRPYIQPSYLQVQGWDFNQSFCDMDHNSMCFEFMSVSLLIALLFAFT